MRIDLCAPNGGQLMRIELDAEVNWKEWLFGVGFNFEDDFGLGIGLGPLTLIVHIS